MPPETGKEDFRATLRILGGSEKKKKTQQTCQEEDDPDYTISDSLSEISKMSSKRSGEEDQVFSQESFGPTSQMSSSNNLQITLSPITKMETPDEDDAAAEDIDKECNLVCQDDINGLFNRVKKSAQAVRAAAIAQGIPQVKKNPLASHARPEVTDSFKEHKDKYSKQSPPKHEKISLMDTEEDLFQSNGGGSQETQSTGKKRNFVQVGLPRP